VGEDDGGTYTSLKEQKLRAWGQKTEKKKGTVRQQLLKRPAITPHVNLGSEYNEQWQKKDIVSKGYRVEEEKAPLKKRL